MERLRRLRRSVFVVDLIFLGLFWGVIMIRVVSGGLRSQFSSSDSENCLPREFS